MRLIDADALKADIEQYWKHLNLLKKRMPKKDKAVIMDVQGYIDSMPTVDAVPVIRCKDCKWYYRGGATCMFWDGANGMCGDDFCGKAERAEE